jgi:hypothetical protein
VQSGNVSCRPSREWPEALGREEEHNRQIASNYIQISSSVSTIFQIHTGHLLRSEGGRSVFCSLLCPYHMQYLSLKA